MGSNVAAEGSFVVPFSMADTACLLTPASSASCSWVSCCAFRSSFSLAPMVVMSTIVVRFRSPIVDDQRSTVIDF